MTFQIVILLFVQVIIFSIVSSLLFTTKINNSILFIGITIILLYDYSFVILFIIIVAANIAAHYY